MSYIITAIVSAVLGFIAGALAARNNQRKLNQKIDQVEAEIARIDAKARRIGNIVTSED